VLKKYRSVFIFLLLVLTSFGFSVEPVKGAQNEAQKALAIKLEKETEKMEVADRNKEITFSNELVKKYYLEGKAYYQEKKYKKAFEILSKAVLEDPHNIDVNYLLGRSAYQLGNYGAANLAYERVLMIDSHHQLSRLEKARTHSKMGEYEKSRMEFERSLEEQLPPLVRQNVELLLAHLSSQQRHIFNGALLVGYTYDSNATTGTGAFDLPITEDIIINIDASAKADNILNSALVLNHQFDLWKKRVFWVNDLLFFVSEYDDQTSFDMRLGQWKTGLNYTYNKFMIDGKFQWMYLFKDNTKYQNSLGFFSKCAFFMNPQITYSLEYSYFHKHYFQEESKNGLTNQLKGAISWIPNDKNICEVSYLYAYDKTPYIAAPPSSYNRNMIAILYTRLLNERMSFSLGGLRRSDKYCQLSTFDPTVKRSDKTLALTTSLTFKVLPTLMLQSVYSYTDNNSNLVINTYSSSQASLNLTWLF
jgi:tetratricopeptide (TPR) repeat protein